MAVDARTRAGQTLGAARAISRHLRCLVIETTLRCDHACLFCGSRAGRSAEGELTTTELARAIAQAAELGAQSVELTGGETYLRDDWLELIRTARRLGLQCALITAGRAIDARLAEMARDAGLSRASVSIDGLAPIHDVLRGVRGSFDQARSALAAFREAGLPVACNTQVGTRNFASLPALAENLLGEGLYAWQIQLMIPMGRAAEREDLWLQPFELLEAIPIIVSVIERSAERGLVVYAGDNVGYFGPHEQSLRRYSSRRGHTLGCAAGVLGLGIDSNGDIKGCSALDGPDFVAGNVRTHDLAALWEDSPVLRMMEDFDPRSLWGYCATCYYASVCRGGCSATSAALTGRPGNNPYCHHRALELAKSGLRERLVRVGGSEGGPRFAAFEVRTERCT